MECRYAEMNFVVNNSIDNAVSELEETCKHLDKIGPLEKEKYGTSLNKWQTILAEGKNQVAKGQGSNIS